MLADPAAHSAIVRDAIVPLFLRKAASDTTDRWIYDYRIDWNAPADMTTATA